jgi:flagellar hook-associated protein 2
MTTTTTTSTGASTTSQVNTAGSTTYVTGTASGLDTQALINAAMAQRTAPADTLDAQVTANKTKIAAYQQLQSLINGLTGSMSRLASQAFSTISSGATDFQAKTVSLTASDTSTASSYLTASATGSAVAATYSLSVDQLAASEADASSAFAQSTPLGFSGSFSLGEAGDTAQTISVTADMSLSDIATAVNAAASQSGVSASMVKDSSGNYRLVLSAADTNKAITAQAVSGDDVLNELGVTDSTGAFADVLQAAQPALVTVAGSQISSDTNEIDDAISGVSLSLSKTTPAGVTLSLAVAPDMSAVKTDVTNFITAYNSLRSFVSANQQVGSDGTVDSSTAPLFADSLLTGASQMLNGVLSAPSASATGAYQTLADLGITLDSDNNLVQSDPTALDTALQKSPAQVAAMFQSSFLPSDSALKLLQNTSTGAFDFDLDVTVDASGNPTAASVDGDTSGFTIQGARIVGAVGGPYQGLSFGLVTNASETIHVSMQPGLANQVVNFAGMYGGVSGFIAQQIADLTSQDDAWSAQSAQIRSDAQDYQTQLIDKYANMEQEVAAAQLVQAQIKAILDGQQSQG